MSDLGNCQNFATLQTLIGFHLRLKTDSEISLIIVRGLRGFHVNGPNIDAFAVTWARKILLCNLKLTEEIA